MLNVEVRGQGEDLVMLHGWGMHSAIWSDWADELAQHFRVHLVDLPGHGESAAASPALSDWSRAVADAVPGNAWWLGWSLGGLVALHAAQSNLAVMRGLVMMAGTPRFVVGDNWSCAVDAGVFSQFARQLDVDIERTLSRFLALQVRGSSDSSEGLRRLRGLLRKRPLAQADALSAGLAFLRDTDLRGGLSAMSPRIFWLFGERDTLVPALLAEQVEGCTAIIGGAGHAPFLSHPDVCARQVRVWLKAAEGASYAAG